MTTRAEHAKAEQGLPWSQRLTWFGKSCQESEVLVRDLEVLMPQSWLGRTHGLVSGNVIITGFLRSSICAAPSDGTGDPQETFLLEGEHSAGGRRGSFYSFSLGWQPASHQRGSEGSPSWGLGHPCSSWARWYSRPCCPGRASDAMCHHAGDQPVIPTSSDHGREKAGDSSPESFMVLPLQGSRRGRV